MWEYIAVYTTYVRVTWEEKDTFSPWVLDYTPPQEKMVAQIIECTDGNDE